jgi:hypothetical protein
MGGPQEDSCGLKNDTLLEMADAGAIQCPWTGALLDIDRARFATLKLPWSHWHYRDVLTRRVFAGVIAAISNFAVLFTCDAGLQCEACSATK